jgi:DNA modification methylase
MEIARRHLDTLIPYARNARIHSDEQIARIAASIDEFGMVGAIVVRDGVIAKGHGTLAAVRKLYGVGKKLYPPPGRAQGAEPFPDGEVPVLDASGWTESQFRAFVIADNRLAELAGWDNELLVLELSELQSDGFAIDVVGFEIEDIGRLLQPEARTGLTEDDEAPAVPETAVSVVGDIWRCDRHRVMCGDCLKRDQVDRLMAQASADLVVTDPPYNVAYEGKQPTHMRIANDDMTHDVFYGFLFDSFRNMFASAADGAGVYVFHADGEGVNFRRALCDAGWKVAQCCVWVKQSLVLGRQDYHWQHEPVLYGWKPTAAHRWYGDRKQSTVWQFDRPARNDQHPTMKPVALMEYPVRNSSRQGDVVLDLFGGSGSTLIACEKLQRSARLMEIDPRYCDVIVRRWQDFTGHAATLAESSMTFAEVEDARK